MSTSERDVTLALHAKEQAVVQGRAPFTVFRWGKRWAFVHWSGRPSEKFASLTECCEEVAMQRTLCGQPNQPIGLDLT